MSSFRTPTCAGLAAFLLGFLWATPAGAISLTVMSYNVQGLPGAPNLTNNLLISPKLNAGSYDIIAIQEAFQEAIYDSHDDNNTGFPDANTSDYVPQTPPSAVNSGLMRLSNSPHSMYDLVNWGDTCSNDTGFDCLGEKGFSFARHDLGGGAEIDVYNWHAEAGNTADDVIARNAQNQILLDYIVANSGDRAVIILGDTNSRWTRTSDDIRDFLGAGFKDAWLEDHMGGVAPAQNNVSNASGCDLTPDSSTCELKDKIFFRSGGNVELTFTAYGVPFADFLDGDDLRLSDHDPITATFDVSVIPEPNTALLLTLGLTLLGTRKRGVR